MGAKFSGCMGACAYEVGSVSETIFKKIAADNESDPNTGSLDSAYSDDDYQNFPDKYTDQQNEEIQDNQHPYRERRGSYEEHLDTVRKKKKVREYEVGNVLGSGGFGTVFSGVRLKDGVPVAIKQILKDKVQEKADYNGKSVPLEICLLGKVQHVSGVIKMLDYYETRNSFILVMERPEHAIDLFEYMKHNGLLLEPTARHFFHQVVEICIHLIENGVVHRDIKDENLLVLTSGQIKLIDFGSATFVQAATYTSLPGTRAYSPPEWVGNSTYHARSATVWSLGILLFVMVCGNVPFADDEDILNIEPPFLYGLTPGIKDLITRCLTKTVIERIKLEAILKHPWMELVGDPLLLDPLYRRYVLH